MIKLSILICRMPSRYAMWGKLQSELWSQILPYANQVQVLSDDRMSVTIGEKRNRLLNDAEGDYVCFIDDDDRIAANYVQLLMEGIEKDVDCCSLVGEITFDGERPKPFIHSLDYTEWYEDEAAYYRNNNHLNCIRASIAKQIGFTNKNHGEDYDFSKKLLESGLLKTEHRIEQTIYYYDYRTNK